VREFELERNFFKDFRSKCMKIQNREIVNEFVKAIEHLLKEYDTSIYENRFIVGGVIEYIFIALLKALGFNASHSGEKDKRTDIAVEYGGNELKFSIKTNFTGKGDIRLINKLGKGSKIFWDEPTIFLISGLGIVYADSRFLGDRTIDKGDAIVINVNSIKIFSDENSDYKVNLEIPVKSEISPSFHTASFDIAKSVLERSNSKILIKYLS
jgi:hypothetical protein